MIAIVSHDAGGAEILSSHVRREGLVCRYVLEGPALNIFKRKLGAIDLLPLEEAVRQSASVLCGTSWQSDLEVKAIQSAGSLGKKTVAFIDHWVNYRERFTRGGATCLPDEIWVGDRMAQERAEKTFAHVPVRLVENPYLKDISDDLARLAKVPSSDLTRLRVLYVCEPVREHARVLHGDERHLGYTEEDAIRYFLSNIAVLGRPIGAMVIRPHPAEPANKYEWVRGEFDLPIKMGGAKPLIEEMVQCDVVAGCESMAMVVGLMAGKRVISCIPPGGRACQLPHPEIQHLARLL